MKGRPKVRAEKNDDEDEYMRRIRARAEMGPGEDSDEEEEGGEGVGEEEEGEDAAFAGLGDEGEEQDGDYSDSEGSEMEEPRATTSKRSRAHEEQQYSSDDGSGSESGEEDGGVKADVLRSLPLAERLALLASGTDTGPRRGRHVGPGAGARRGAGKAAEATLPAKEGKELKAKKKKKKPKEMPSNKPVGRFRVVVERTAGKGKLRDPRFDDAIGKLDYSNFRKAYSFLVDYQQNEIQALKVAAKKAKSASKKGEVKAALSKLQSERAERERFDRKADVLQRAKRDERAKVAAGKTPFFLKRRDKRRLELEDRYERLAKEGKLERFMEKKRKRNAAKDHRWLPRTRRRVEGEDA